MPRALSPWKDFLLEHFFAIKGVFSYWCSLLLAVGFRCRLQLGYNFPVCGFVYYLNIVILALIGVVIAFLLVARRYQY